MDGMEKARQRVYAAALGRAYAEEAYGGRETTGASASLDMAHDEWHDALAGYVRAHNRSASSDELAGLVRRAISDPGAFVGSRRGPSWRKGSRAYAEVQESVAEWSTRAVMAVLAGAAASGLPRPVETTQAL